MYYALNIYPRLSDELLDSISAIRKDYDPTAPFTKVHITVLFPVPGRVGEETLIDHIENVLNDWSPFEIELGGFHKTHDHWLFLTLSDGADQVKKLYRQLYSGMLEEFRREDIEFVPHIGLGLFMKAGTNYDWNNPKEADFDGGRYDEAMSRAKSLPLPARMLVEKLNMTRIPDELLEWATGKRIDIPTDSQIVELRQFSLHK